MRRASPASRHRANTVLPLPLISCPAGPRPASRAHRPATVGTEPLGRRLQAVVQQPAKFLDVSRRRGLANGRAGSRLGRHRHAAKHLGRGQAHRRADQHQIERSAQPQRLDPLAAAGTPGGRRGEEERHVAAQLGAQRGQFGRGPSPAATGDSARPGWRPHRSSRRPGRPPAGCASTGGCPRRRGRPAALPHQLDGPADQVVGAGRQSRDDRSGAGRRPGGFLRELQRVVQADGHHQVARS